MRAPSSRLVISFAAAAAFTVLAFGSSDSSDTTADIAPADYGARNANVQAPSAVATETADGGMYGSIPADSLYGQMLTAPEVDAMDSLYGAEIDADNSLYGSPPSK